MKQTRKIKVIGAGGIGGHLIEPLSRYLTYCDEPVEITVIDGDKFEDRNRERQRFTECENKADHTVGLMKEEFPRVHFRSNPEFITDSNVITSIRENDVVLLCVDNHATRKLVSERCSELDNVTLISGGNDETDGDVLVYVRKNGKDVTPPLTSLPEIAGVTDNSKNPGDLTDEEREGCEREAQTKPQILFMNLDIASLMLSCYYAHEQGKLKAHRIFTDILTQARRAVKGD